MPCPLSIPSCRSKFPVKTPLAYASGRNDDIFLALVSKLDTIYFVNLIKERTLNEWAAQYPTALSTLRHWKDTVTRLDFDNFADLRRAIPSADQVKVASGRIVTVFNIKNQFRLIAAIHYNRRLIYVLRFLTHADYDKDTWKNEL